MINSDWEFFFEIGKKRRIFWIENGAHYRPLVTGRKGPGASSVCNILTVGVLLSSTPSISSPVSATDCSIPNYH